MYVVLYKITVVVTVYVCFYDKDAMLKVSYANEKLIFACTNTTLLSVFLGCERNTGIFNAKNMVFSANLEHYFENVYVLVGHTLTMFKVNPNRFNQEHALNLQLISRHDMC